jgi:hypothetical protein
MTQEIINIGALPNDGEGDPLRTAFQKINNNFTQLFSTDFYTTEAYTVGNTSQVIFEVPVAEFTQGIFQINSSNPANQQSQNITLVASKTNNSANVKWTGYGTLFFGDPVTTYDMDVSGSNVRILASSIANTTVFHFISSQITFVGNTIPGLDIALDGYPDSVMATEDGLILATET